MEDRGRRRSSARAPAASRWRGSRSHRPDHLRVSAEAIRAEATRALQEAGRQSVLAPVIKRIQSAAREIQELTENAAPPWAGEQPDQSSEPRSLTIELDRHRVA